MRCAEKNKLWYLVKSHLVLLNFDALVGIKLYRLWVFEQILIHFMNEFIRLFHIFMLIMMHGDEELALLVDQILSGFCLFWSNFDALGGIEL